MTVVSADEQRVPVERFLGAQKSFRRIRNTHDLDVLFTDDARQIFEDAKRQERIFQAAQGGNDDGLTEAEVEALLAQTTFSRKLTWFQLRNVTKLYNLQLAGQDFSVPGAGKTTTALAVHALLRADGVVDRLLIIAPLSAHEAWEEDCEKCFAEPLRLKPFGKRDGHEDAVVIHYQLVARRYEALAQYCRDHNVHLVLDEAHRMKKGRIGQWGRACIDLAFLAKRRDVLTGTPAPQSARDLEALLAATWPGASNGLIPPAAGSTNAPAEELQRVAARIRPLFVRTTKGDLDLPRPEVLTRHVPMGPLQAEIYQALRIRWRDAIQAGPVAAQVRRLGRVSTYLLMAALHPGLLSAAVRESSTTRLQWPLSDLPTDADLIDKIDHYGAFEHPAKYEALLAMVKENADQGRKTLVWSSFVNSVNAIANDYLAAFEPAVFHGLTPQTGDDDDPDTRANQVRRFRNDPNCFVLVANPAAMSEGISLHHHCHEAIYVDRTFNAGQFLQSVDRIHRLGLDPSEHTRIRLLVSTDTVDEVISDRLAIKTDALGLMLDDPELALLRLTNEEDDEDERLALDDADREALLSHLKGTQ